MSTEELQGLQREVESAVGTTHTSLLCLEETAGLEIEAFHHIGPHFHAPGPELLAGCLDSG